MGSWGWSLYECGYVFVKVPREFPFCLCSHVKMQLGVWSLRATTGLSPESDHSGDIVVINNRKGKGRPKHQGEKRHKEGTCLSITPGNRVGWPEWVWPLQGREHLEYLIPWLKKHSLGSSWHVELDLWLVGLCCSCFLAFTHMVFDHVDPHTMD